LANSLDPVKILLRDRFGVSALVFDYRGYGRSKGTPSEAGILADARAARRWLGERPSKTQATHSRRDGAMKMDVPPATRAQVPNAGFFEGGRRGLAIAALALVEADAGDNRHVAQHAHARTAHCRLAAFGAQLEIEAVELQALDELSPRLRLERRQTRIAQFLIGFPIGAGDTVEELLIQTQQLGRCI